MVAATVQTTKKYSEVSSTPTTPLHVAPQQAPKPLLEPQPTPEAPAVVKVVRPKTEVKSSAPPPNTVLENSQPVAEKGI